MNFFNFEGPVFRKNIFKHRKKPPKLKYINFREFLSLITGGTNQVIEVQ